ncbi:MAG: two-component system cell cycle sensor histidine kinase/response regulator CckA [Kiritimatiellia bacterium]
MLIPMVDATAEAPVEDLVPTPSAGGRARILVIDDQPLPLRVVCRALQDRYSVVTEIDPQKAYQRLAAGEPMDLIITDIMMPGMTGDDLCRQVINVRPDLDGRFLFITGAMLRDGQQEWLASVGARVLRKPFGIEQLRRFVGEQLGDSFAEEGTPQP